uniref:Uncharacterized protein n=1 Tax=Rhizophora mucronata TaxID=61149 RepID=A0A2P2N1S2_RHIMU
MINPKRASGRPTKLSLISCSNHGLAINRHHQLWPKDTQFKS